MIKYLSSFRIKPEFDPEETYRIWVESHAPAFREKYAGRLKKYTIYRIQGVSEADAGLYGMVEFRFDDMETAKKVIDEVKQDISARPDGFAQRITDFRRMFVLEKTEIDLQS